MSTEYTLEDVLEFLEAEEQSGEYTDQNVAKFEKEKISTPPKVESEEEPEELEETEETEEEPEEQKPAIIEEQEESSEEDEITEGDIPNAYYKFLVDNNVIVVDENFKFDGSADALEEALLKTRENLTTQALTSLWNRLSPDFQAALKYNLDGGKSFEEFAKVYSKTDDISAYDLNKLDDQKAIVEKYYKLTSKYSDERIQKFINRLIETEELYDEAEDALEYIKEHQVAERKKLLEETEQKRLEQEKAVEEWRSGIIGLINDSEIPKPRRSKVQAFLLNPIKRGESVGTDFERTLSAIFQNPQHYIQLADILYNYDEKKGLDLSRFVEKQKTQASSKFQKELEEALRTGGKARGGSPEAPSKSLKLDWENILEQLDN